MTSNLPLVAQWIVAFAPVGTFTVAALAAGVGWRTLRQKQQADARTHWWDRTKWAVEQAEVGETVPTTVGLRVLQVQAQSRLLGEEENRVIKAIWEPIVGTRLSILSSDSEPVLQYRVEGESGEGEGHGIA